MTKNDFKKVKNKDRLKIYLKSKIVNRQSKINQI